MSDPIYLYQNVDFDNVIILLENFTNKELFKTYYLSNLDNIDNRTMLIYEITRNIMTNKWSVNRHGGCSNDDGMNIITGVERRIVNMTINEDEDLLLSYGSSYYYNCYTITELMGSFRRDGEDYIFSNPDYNPLDPRSQSEFSLEDIRDLSLFLKINGYSDEYPEFIRFLDDGYKYVSERRYDHDVYEQIEQYSNLDGISKQQIKRFIIW